MPPRVLHHVSEDPAISRFRPHVPRTNPAQAPAVWPIDADHAPLYWFPRHCPRVTAWPRDDAERHDFAAAFVTTGRRVHGTELMDRMRTTALYRYDRPVAAFERWAAASGQWITREDVEPVSVTPLGDLLAAHVDAGIELRFVPSLWPLHDLAISAAWEFSIVRMANAQPRLRA